MIAQLDAAPPLLRDGALFIDNSTFEAVPLCHRLAEYRILWKRKLRGHVSALNFGKAAHCGLDTLYRARPSLALDHISLMQQAALASLDLDPCEEGDWRNAGSAAALMQAYALTYPTEPWRTATSDEFGIVGAPASPLVELPFAVPLGSVTLAEPLLLPNMQSGNDPDRVPGVFMQDFSTIPVVWTGKIDLVVWRDSELWLVDHKTTSVYGPSYYDQFYLSAQMTGYAWALRSLLNRSVAGVCINVLASRKPTRTGVGVEFGRQFIRLPDSQLNEWQGNTLTLLSDFFSSLAREYFPMSTSQCVSKFNRKCDYFKVCSLDPAYRAAMLFSDHYEPITWSPLAEVAS